MDAQKHTVDLNTLPLGANGLYFIGIGGIGMSALARYFLSKGIRVSGYDKTSTPLTRLLEEEGADIHYEENVELIPKNTGLVVYTPAIPAAHAELVTEHSFAIDEDDNQGDHGDDQKSCIQWARYDRQARAVGDHHRLGEPGRRVAEGKADDV